MNKNQMSRQTNGKMRNTGTVTSTPMQEEMVSEEEISIFSQPAVPGEGPNASQMPALPDTNQPAAPGQGPDPFPTPTLPNGNQPAAPGQGPNPLPTPTLPNGNQPAAPGQGPYPLPTPSLPGGSGNVIGGIGVIPLPGITISPRQLSYIRFLHAAPDTPNVDVFANGRLIASNISYQNFTEYFRATPGLYTIQVYGTGRRVRPLFTARINLFPNMIYTAAITGERSNVELELISDRPRTLSQNTAYMRFINLSPDSPELDIYVNDRLVIREIEYQEVSNYLTMRPGTYSIAFKLSGTQDTVLYDPAATLRGGVAYATFLVGKLYGTPGLEVLIPMEGVTYLKF